MNFRPTTFRPNAWRPILFRPAGPQHGYRVYRRATRAGSDALIAIAPPGSDTLDVAHALFTASSDQFVHVRAVSHCGIEDAEAPKLRRIRFDDAGNLILPSPNAPSSLHLVRGSGGAMAARWEYITQGQEIAPATFNVYVAEGADPFDFDNADFEVDYVSGRRFHSAALGTFDDGVLVRVVVRSVSAAGTEEPNVIAAMLTADASAPTAPTSIEVEVERE